MTSAPSSPMRRGDTVTPGIAADKVPAIDGRSSASVSKPIDTGSI